MARKRRRKQAPAAVLSGRLASANFGSGMATPGSSADGGTQEIVAPLAVGPGPTPGHTLCVPASILLATGYAKRRSGT